MNRWWSKRVLAVFSVCLLAMFIIRPSAGRLRGRVSQSLSQALGRSVEISSLHLRLLPRPSFQLANLVVHDDPAFGAEPLLRAPDVSAYVSLGALLRGKLQVSTLSVSEASLNLTRDPQGRWNLHDAVERTSRSNLAPTGRLHSGGSPFPYIEGTRARVNLKIGSEKTHFALTDTEFALWQDSENTWGLRVKGSPIRTDTNLTDTGTVEVNGLWRRAPILQQTPVQFSFQWKHAQIGQVSKLVYGTDQGWRGDAILNGAISGTPEKLKGTAEASVDDFRRQDVIGRGNLRLRTQCAAEYSITSLMLTNLDCIAPSSDGTVEIKGESAEHGGAGTTYNFQLSAIKIPASAITFAIQHLNPRLTIQPVSDGQVNGSFKVTRNESGSVAWQGEGSIKDLELSSPDSQLPISIAEVPFSISSGDAKELFQTHIRNGAKQVKTVGSSGGQGDRSDPSINVGPFNLTDSKPDSLQVRANLSFADYQASARGAIGLKRLLQLAQTFGIPAPVVSAEGNANVDLTVFGNWSSKERPLVTGHAQLRSLKAQVRGLNAPLEVASANVTIRKDKVEVQNLTAVAAATWHGNLSFDRPCVAPRDCQIEFNLKTPELSADALNKLLNPSQAKNSWYRIFSVSESPKPYLIQVRATGKLAIDKLVLGSTDCKNFSSDVRLDSGELSLANYRAEVLGGRISGNLKADFNGKKPSYAGNGGFDGVSLSSIADLMNDDWAQGSGDAKYEFTAQGSSFSELFDSADLKSDFEVSDAAFPHVTLSPTSGALRASTFAGSLLLQEGQFTFSDTKLEGPSGVYKVSGTAALDGSLSLKMTSDNNGTYNVTGTLLKTRVAAMPTAQASLKP